MVAPEKKYNVLFGEGKVYCSSKDCDTIMSGNAKKNI